jgi:hypothetical protein
VQSGAETPNAIYKSAGIRLKKLSQGMIWHDKLDASRGVALKKWLSLVTAGGLKFSLVE